MCYPIQNNFLGITIRGITLYFPVQNAQPHLQTKGEKVETPKKSASNFY
uniref:Uncharacterized protein n=1 Tax=Rhizophora mucronata TaxID=61149 RepID=A0A2P2QFQ4_RHIMU